jgi:hypothetical protein
VKQNKFAYGSASFQKIREGGYFYVDKTHFIEVLEDLDLTYALFLRPPRFGKTLFLNMLGCYYDKNTTEQQYKRWFEGLNIYEYSRREGSQARSYYILHFDFSIETEGLDAAGIRVALYKNINHSIGKFARKYDLTMSVDEDALISLKRAADAVELAGGRLYVFVDEYDRFANKLMVENRAAYVDVVAGESKKPASSPIRAFFETLKELGKWSGLRVLTTGILPLALADASGYNVAMSLTHDAKFAALVGFTENDLKRALRLIPNLNDGERQQALNLMRRYYNGYRFVGSKEALYNSTLSLSFLIKLSERGRALLESPLDSTMTDSNVSVRGSFLSLMRESAGGVRALSRIAQCDAEWRDSGCALSSRPSVEVASLESVFTLEQLLLPESSDVDSDEQPLLLMFYRGVLTLCGHNKLVVPNLVASKELVKLLVARVLLPQRSLPALIVDPSIDGVAAMLRDVIVNLSGVEMLCDNNFKEVTVQALVCGVLTTLRHERNEAIRVKSEGKIEKFDVHNAPTGRNGFFDVLLTATGNDGRLYGILLEIKRVVPRQMMFNDADINSKKAKQVRFVSEQIRTELESSGDEIRNYRFVDHDEKIKKISDLIAAAQLQVRGYIAGTVKKFDLHQLRTFVVVSVATRIIVENADM